MDQTVTPGRIVVVEKAGVIQRHFASFKAGHNDSKLRALILLFMARNGQGMTLSNWAKYANVGYKYLSSRGECWEKWGYIRRKPSKGKRGPCYLYRIDKKGMKILNYAKKDYPDFYTEQEKIVMEMLRQKVIVKVNN